MCDEIIGYVKRLMRGVRVDDVTLALEAIKRVGPMGEFVTDPHTYDNFKKELWFPKIMDRHPCQRWIADGSLTMGDKAMARVRSLIENHEPEPLDEKVKAEIDKLLSNLS
jgi:trimethylamine--corrinoid protein Co-methyltransferase